MAKKKPNLAKANPLGLPELSEVRRRERDGHIYRPPVERDPSRAALEGRCRRAGLEVSDHTLRDMRAPWNGCEAGRAMAAAVSHAEERARLWVAICHMRRVQAAYDASIGAPHRHATCLRMLLPPDDGEEDFGARPAPDDRTPEERSRDAVSALMAIEEWLGWTDRASAGEAKRVVIDDTPVADQVGLILALRCVSDGCAGRRMTYLGRDIRA